ncbi:hypothetical protein, partial [Burkholderia thailandensis]|uniref:hypothetical protein n=1 Tax=Burkholderia thailandensis TaxID=57975 RepID=UPI0021C5E707
MLADAFVGSGAFDAARITSPSVGGGRRERARARRLPHADGRLAPAFALLRGAGARGGRAARL